MNFLSEVAVAETYKLETLSVISELNMGEFDFLLLVL